MTKPEKKTMREAGKEAWERRGELIEKFKKQGKRGNVLVNLKNGFVYKYGVTIPDPQIVIPGIYGHQLSDWDFWEKFGK